jgi:O-antigen ligase
LTGGVLMLSMVLGGGTKTGFLADAALQLAAVPLLVISLFAIRRARLGPGGRVAVAIALAAVAIAAFQLIPLPAAGTWLPSARFTRVGAEDILPSVNTFLPVSMSPRDTCLALLAGLPALAIFLATCLLSLRQRRALTLLVLAVGLVSIFIGLLQVAQGPSSSLRFFQITNPLDAVGFFANRNHFAALLYVLLLFCAAWTVAAVQKIGASPSDRRLNGERVVPLILALTMVAILVAMQTLARSRAGIGLTILALLGFGALSIRSRAEGGSSSTRLIVGAGVFGVLLAIQFTLYRILERFAQDPLADARLPFARHTIEAAAAHLPFGSGLGTFVEVYGLFERPQDGILDVFANRAHNDFLEAWLETGVPGAALLVAFAGWFAFAVFMAWRRPGERQAPIDLGLPRAASLAVLLLLVHSLVDYPLRTAALLALFAFACALLVAPSREVAAERAAESDAGLDVRPAVQAEMVDARVFSPAGSVVEDAARNWAARREAPEPSSPPPGQVPAAAPAGRPWGEGIDWPAEWRKPATSEQRTAASGPARRTDDRNDPSKKEN